MSSSPRTAVGTGINGTDAISKVGYLKGSGGVAPLSNMGMFLGAHSVCRLSLLNSLYARRGMLLTNWLERRGGIFFDSASTFFFGSSGSGSGELLEDNSLSATALLSADRRGSLPLFFLTKGGGGSLPRTIFASSPSRRVRRRSFSCYR